jgi:hypothetical protein
VKKIQGEELRKQKPPPSTRRALTVSHPGKGATRDPSDVKLPEQQWCAKNKQAELR